MKRVRLSIFAACACIGTVRPQIIPGQHVLVFKDHVQDHPAVVESLAAQHGLAVAYVYRHAIKGFAFGGSERAVAALVRRPDVAYVEQDQVVRVAGQTIPTGVDRVDVERAVRIDGTDDAIPMNIAIVDTGPG